MSVETIRWINDFFISCTMVAAMCAIHPRRFGKLATCILGLLWSYFYVEASAYFELLSQFKALAGIAIMIIMGLGLFKDKWHRILLSIALILLMMIINELLGMFYYPDEIFEGNISGLSPEDFLRVNTIFAISYILLMFMLVFFVNHYRYSMSGRDMALVMLFPVSQFMLIYGWLDAVRLELADNLMKVAIVFVACIVADIALFIIIRSVSQRARLEAENRLLAEQVEKQDRHYAELTAQYENIRRMRHDIANHLNAMESLMDTGDDHSARQYLKELKADAALYKRQEAGLK